MLSTNPTVFSTMQPHQQFVESLIALKNHYQSLQSKIESERLHAQNQLNHVNALLVDQLVSDQRFSASLIELRQLYQAIVASGESQAAHIKEQLTHVQALLADQVVQHHAQLISMSQANSNENKNHALATVDVDNGKSLRSANKPEPEAVKGATFADAPKNATDGESADAIPSPHHLQNGNIPPLEAEDDSGSPTDEEVDDTTQISQMKSEPDVNTLSQVPTDEMELQENPVLEVALVASEPELSESGTANSQATKGKSRTFTPMLPQYQQLTKFAAIESLLKENAGTILHVDYMIRALHGELADIDIKTEKARMAQALSDGAKKGWWDKVPSESGCYTIDLKLVEPDLAAESDQPSITSKPHKPHSKSDLQPKMLPAYAQLKTIDAIDLVINQQAGQVLTTDLLVKTLYGKLSGTKLTRAKEIVGKALWRGADTWRWQRLPGGKGQYTLDLRLVEPKTESS